MLKVLIAEDELLDFSILRKLINWDELGLTLVGIARDGLDAARMVEEYQPDIIITDIVMPGITGTEMASVVHRKYPNMHIIFISGHPDFEYALAGIDAEIDGYLLKPVDFAQLNNILMQVIDKCIKEKKQEFEKENLNQIIKSNWPMLQSLFLNQLIRAPSADEQKVAEQLAYYQISLQNTKLCVVLLRPDQAELCEKDEYNRQRDRFEVLRAIDEIISGIPDAVYFHVLTTDEFAIIFSGSLDEQYEQIAGYMRKIIVNIQMLSNISFTAGIGRIVTGYNLLPASFQSAGVAVANRFYKDKGQVILYQDITDNREIFLPEFPEIKQQIIRALISRDDVLVYCLLNGFFSEISSIHLAAETVRILCIDLINSTLYELNKVSCNRTADILGHDLPLSRLLMFENLFDVTEYIKNWFHHIGESLTKNTTDRYLALVDSIKAIIRRNLDKDVTVKFISSQLYISQGYATHIFRKVTGEGINRYLIKERMAEAAKLLRNPSLKILDVARMVGYNDSSYFSSMFKNEIGITPKAFREQLIHV
jgi:two-component system, response regulator YesN